MAKLIRITYEGTKSDIKALKDLITFEGLHFWRENFVVVKNDYSITDATCDSKLEIARAVDKIKIRQITSEEKIADEFEEPLWMLNMPYFLVEELIKHHINVFNIPETLYIDKSTVKI